LLLVWWLQREFLFAHLMVLVSLSSFAWSLALILLSEVMSSSLIIASIRSTLKMPYATSSASCSSSSPRLWTCGLNIAC
jgi:hypothetical protein